MGKKFIIRQAPYRGNRCSDTECLDKTLRTNRMRKRHLPSSFLAIRITLESPWDHNCLNKTAHDAVMPLQFHRLAKMLNLYPMKRRD
jgi:hypothetical protein